MGIIAERIASMGVPLTVASMKPQRRDDYMAGHRYTRSMAAAIVEDADRRLEVAQRMADALGSASRVLFHHCDGWKTYLSNEQVREMRSLLAEWEATR